MVMYYDLHIHFRDIYQGVGLKFSYNIYGHIVPFCIADIADKRKHPHLNHF